MAMLMVELVRRDLDYGPFCFEEYYNGEIADHLRKSREYEVCIDFVRRMLRRHDVSAICQHRWVDPSNSVVQAGKYMLCQTCGKLEVRDEQ